MKAQPGFTLIELAVVIAIIAILGAVAMHRYNDTVAQAEAAAIKDLKGQLASAGSIYLAENAQPAKSFEDFVDANKTATKPKTIAIGGFSKKPLSCSVAASKITCAATSFSQWNGVEYTLTHDVVTVKATANSGAGNSQPNIDQ